MSIAGKKNLDQGWGATLLLWATDDFLLFYYYFRVTCYQLVTSIRVGLSIQLLAQMYRYGTIRDNILDSDTKIWHLTKPTSQCIAC